MSRYEEIVQKKKGALGLIIAEVERMDRRDPFRKKFDKMSILHVQGEGPKNLPPADGLTGEVLVRSLMLESDMYWQLVGSEVKVGHAYRSKHAGLAFNEAGESYVPDRKVVWISETKHRVGFVEPGIVDDDRDFQERSMNRFLHWVRCEIPIEDYEKSESTCLRHPTTYEPFPRRRPSVTAGGLDLCRQFTEGEIEEGKCYRAARPIEVCEGLGEFAIADRKVISISSSRDTVTYDGPGLPIDGLYFPYPTVFMSSFLKWVGREIDPTEYARKVPE